MNQESDSKYEKQSKAFFDMLEEASAFGASEKQIDHMDKLVEVLNCHYIEMPKFHGIDNGEYGKMVGFEWKFSDVYLSCWFNDSDKWGWYATKKLTRNMQGHSEYFAQYSHSGACTWYLEREDKEDEPHYWFPEIVEKWIKKEEPFSKSYEPLLSGQNNGKPQIIWSTSRYDGPLAGYCFFKNKVHFYENVEETEMNGDRMYAFYELSTFDQVSMWSRFFKWNRIKSSEFLLRLHSKWFAWKLKRFGPKKYSERKLVGYYKNIWE